MRYVPYETGWLGLGVAFLFWALLAPLVIWAVWRLTSAGGHAGGPPPGGPPPGGPPPVETPEDILRRRFAAGEIDEAEYQHRLEVLRRR